MSDPPNTHDADRSTLRQLWRGIKATVKGIATFLDLLEVLVFALLVVVLFVAILWGLWQDAAVRPWLIGAAITVPVLIALRRRP